MKVSIITINLNNCKGLRSTIESVLKQTCNDYEYIVIDGGSSDGSVDVIKEYEDRIDYWVSEPDKGVYNAMNKGIQKATGEYCQFLNSGDTLYDECVIQNFKSIKKTADVVLGRTQLIKGGGTVRLQKKLDLPLSFIQFYRASINHQSAFIRRDLLLKYPYDESYRICSDWKFFIQVLIINDCSFDYVNFIVANFSMDGISNQQVGLLRTECKSILNEFRIPKRILIDYNSLDFETMEIARLLHQYEGFRIFSCKLIKALCYIYSAITKLFRRM